MSTPVRKWDSSQEQRPILLDHFTVEELRARRDLQERFLRYHWDVYNDLAFKRSKVVDKIKKRLREAAKAYYKFSKWQRAVTYRYSDQPFSITGSILDPAGGRFNIGDINPAQFPKFPALYIALDKPTAMQEALCQQIPSGQENQALDFALMNPTSISMISMSGLLSSYIDLSDPARLKPFVELIKHFPIPEPLKKEAKELRLPPLQLIKTVPDLMTSLLNPDWRFNPMQCDVPAPSQLFGQLVSEAGIEGIIYASKYSSRPCLAVYLHNFEEGSFIQLDEPAPAGVKIRRVDSKTWDDCECKKSTHYVCVTKLGPNETKPSDDLPNT